MVSDRIIIIQKMISIDWNWIHYLVFYFIIYSVGGWILESLYKSVCERKLINSGFMYGPYCPIYGFGTLIMLLALGRLTDNVILLFIVSFVVLSFWEYIVAIFLEKAYHTTYWNYSNKKMNIKGRVCLLNSCYWGILGVTFIKIIHPFISTYSQMLPTNLVIYLDYAIGVIMITDCIISSIKINAITAKFDQIKELNERIKDKLAYMKSNIEISKNEEEEILLEKLQLQHNIMKIKLYRQLIRLRKVFPTMKSDTVNKILSEKVDIVELKEKVKSLKEHAKLIKTKIKNKYN